MEKKEIAAKLIVGAVTVSLGIGIAKSGAIRLIDGVTGLVGLLGETIKDVS